MINDDDPRASQDHDFEVRGGSFEEKVTFESLLYKIRSVVFSWKGVLAVFFLFSLFVNITFVKRDGDIRGFLTESCEGYPEFKNSKLHLRKFCTELDLRFPSYLE